LFAGITLRTNEILPVPAASFGRCVADLSPGRPITAGDWLVIFKVASILLLAVLGFRVNALLGSALVICALGDLLLGARRH